MSLRLRERLPGLVLCLEPERLSNFGRDACLSRTFCLVTLGRPPASIVTVTFSFMCLIGRGGFNFFMYVPMTSAAIVSDDRPGLTDLCLAALELRCLSFGFKSSDFMLCCAAKEWRLIYGFGGFSYTAFSLRGRLLLFLPERFFLETASTGYSRLI